MKLPKKINWKKEANNALSRLVRADNVCRFHQKIQERHLTNPCSCGGAMQACHKITRANLSTFIDERNVFCGCQSSNAWSHWNQPKWDLLWREMFPEDIEYLEELKKKKVKISNWTYGIMAEEFDRRFARIC